MSPVPFREFWVRHIIPAGEAQCLLTASIQYLVNLPSGQGKAERLGGCWVFRHPLVARTAQSDAQLGLQPARLPVGAAPEFVDFRRHTPAGHVGEPVAPAVPVTFEHRLAALGSGASLRRPLLRDWSHEPPKSTVCSFQPSSSSGE